MEKGKVYEFGDHTHCVGCASYKPKYKEFPRGICEHECDVTEEGFDLLGMNFAVGKLPPSIGWACELEVEGE